MRYYPDSDSCWLKANIPKYQTHQYTIMRYNLGITTQGIHLTMLSLSLSWIFIFWLKRIFCTHFSATLSKNIRTIDSNYHFVGKSIDLFSLRDCISLHRLMTKIMLSQQLALLHCCWQRKPFQRHDYWPQQPLVVIIGWSNKKHKIIHKYCFNV